MSPKVFISKSLRRILYPLLSEKMRLPFVYWLHDIQDNLEPELRQLHRLIPSNKKRTAIDIGANIGLYSFRMSRMWSKVYSFEINQELTHDLSAYNPGNIEVVGCGLSSGAGEMTLRIPVVNGLSLHGWGSVEPGNHLQATHFQEKKVRVRTLDSFAIANVDFIKIDVEGHELKVLQGAKETLLRSRPLLLVETVGESREAVIRFLADLGYFEDLEKRRLIAGASQCNCIFSYDVAEGHPTPARNAL